MKTHVTTIAPDAPLAEAVDLMDLYRVVSLPVVDKDGRLCGILTEGDVLRALLDACRDSTVEPLTHLRAIASDLAAQPVQSVMRAPAQAVQEMADLREAAEMLMASNWKLLPVLTDAGRIIGTLNREDILQALFDGIL